MSRTLKLAPTVRCISVPEEEELRAACIALFTKATSLTA